MPNNTETQVCPFNGTPKQRRAWYALQNKDLQPIIAFARKMSGAITYGEIVSKYGRDLAAKLNRSGLITFKPIGKGKKKWVIFNFSRCSEVTKLAEETVSAPNKRTYGLGVQYNVTPPVQTPQPWSSETMIPTSPTQAAQGGVLETYHEEPLQDPIGINEAYREEAQEKPNLEALGMTVLKDTSRVWKRDGVSAS